LRTFQAVLDNQSKAGFNDRHGADYESKSGQALPYHPAVLRQELQRIDPDSLANVHPEAV
jgi:hypothetical protein